MTGTEPTMTMRFGGLNDDGPGTDDDWMRVAPDNGNLKEVVPARDEASVDPVQIFCTFAGERIAEGRAEGERAKACEIAAKLMAAGMSREDAAEFVEIEEGEI